MTKSQLEYLNKFFPDDQIDELIRIKNEINLLGEDDFANYIWETSRESFILDEINMDHNRLVKNMIYVIDYFKRVKEFNNVHKMFGFMSYFIEDFDKKNKLKNFTEDNLLHLYLSISSSLNPKYIDTTDDLLDFDTDLYDVMGRLIDTQYTTLVRMKEKRSFGDNEYFFLPWSNFEVADYSDNAYVFSGMNISTYEYPDLINFSIIETQNEIKVYLYYVLCWLDRTIEMKNIKKFEMELNHACDQSKNYFLNKKTKFKDNLLSQLHIIDEEGYIFRREELETFIKNIDFK